MIQEEIPVALSLRSSPDSSTDPWGCPQCGQGAENESKLLEHLLQEHKIRVVPPQSPTKTRCPVCRKHVADLSQHFANEHGDQQQSHEMNPQGLLSGGGASVTRIIPIVLPSQPGKIYNTRRNTPKTKLEHQITLRIVGYHLSSRLTATLNLCRIYLKLLVHVLYYYG